MPNFVSFLFFTFSLPTKTISPPNCISGKKNLPIVHFSLPLHQDANAWSLLGHTHFLMGDFPSAKDCYERTVDYVTRPAHLHAVYLRLADIYLREQQVAMCGEHNCVEHNCEH